MIDGEGKESLRGKEEEEKADVSELAQESSGPALLGRIKAYLDHLELLSLVPLYVVVDHRSAVDNTTPKDHKATK